MQDEKCIQIYKYRSLSGQHGREAIEHALMRNELYWQSPVDFNDPFDCIPVLYFGDNASQREEFTRGLQRSIMISLACYAGNIIDAWKKYQPLKWKNACE